jgi:hypothetical protein
MDLPVISTRKKRLIVLIPESVAGNLELAHKIYWIAIREQYEVYYLTLLDNDENILSIQRYMATMKAVTEGNFLTVHSDIVKTSGWLKTLREIYGPGDRIVCHEEQLVKDGFMRTSPITAFLRDKMHSSVLTLSGFYHPQQVQMQRWVHALIAWLGFLLILVGFTMLEVQLDPVIQGLHGKLLFGVLFTMEVGSIWAWDRITGN